MEGKADTRTKHPHFTPLQSIWQDMKRRGRRGVDPEWTNFWNFFEWAISNKWEPGCTIRRIYSDEPNGPENCYIDFGGKKPINLDEIDAKGGYKNSPCRTCGQEDAGSCTQYKTCIRYRAWLHQSWKDFREAALAKYGKTTID